jgi:hypothetical protein
MIDSIGLFVSRHQHETGDGRQELRADEKQKPCARLSSERDVIAAPITIG